MALAAVDWEKGLDKDASVELPKLASTVDDASSKLLVQMSTQDAALLASLSKLQETAGTLSGRIGSDPREGFGQSVLQAYASAMKGIVAALQALVGWPLVALVGIYLLIAQSDKMGGILNLFGDVKSIKIAGGNEIVFSAAQADERSRTANEIFASYRVKAAEEFAAMAEVHEIPTRLKNVCEQGVKPHLEKTITSMLVRDKKIIDADAITPKEQALLDAEVKERWKSMRFNIHVEDLLFNETLCQLVDYYPDGKGKAGRAWSVRYGMIGRVWRFQRSYTDTNVTTDEDKLVTNWGMTRDEVRNFVSKGKTFTTVVLESNSQPCALVYMDSKMENAFGLEKGEDSREALHNAISAACEKFNLTTALAKVSRLVQARKLDIQIYG